MKKCGIWCIQTVSQAYYVEILKLLRESVRKKRPELWPSYLVTMPQLKRHCLSASLAQTSITELEHPPCSPGLAPNDFWLFPKIKSALKGRRFQYIEDTQIDVTTALKAVPQTGVPKKVSKNASIVGLST